MERFITASNDDLGRFLFGDRNSDENQESEFLNYVRGRAKSYADLLTILENGMNGEDEELISVSNHEANRILKNTIIHPAYIEAIRTSNINKIGKGLEAGVIIATARHLKAFSVCYYENEDIQTDLYCSKNVFEPFALSIHLGQEVWLDSYLNIRTPLIPETLALSMVGKPLSEAIEHPCVSKDDMIEEISHEDKTIIKGIKERYAIDCQFSARKL